MNKIILLLTISLDTILFGQIGVGTDTPSQSSMVDLVSSIKGFSGSHISLQSVTDKTTIPNPADGLLVYNTNTTSDLEPGYYVWIINKWTASKPTLNLEVTTNGELVELLGYEANGSAPTIPTSFVSEGRTFTALGCKNGQEMNTRTVLIKAQHLITGKKLSMLQKVKKDIWLLSLP